MQSKLQLAFIFMGKIVVLKILAEGFAETVCCHIKTQEYQVSWSLV